jgi:hypothetical protein
MKNDGHCAKGTYVITHDLGERIQSLRLLGLKTPNADDPFFTELHTKIKERIASILPTIDVVTYSMNELVEEVWAKAIHLQEKIQDAIVVSSCAEVANPRRGHVIEINRIANKNGETIGFGPRPGNPSLSKQVSGIALMSNGNPVVLVEDGSFTGSTFECLLNQLKQKRVNVVAIVSGICFPDALSHLSDVFDGEIVVMKKVDKPYEWMPDHDFIPFAPNCGRVYGGSFGDEMLPYYTHEGLSYCFPYILPFGDPTKWASIPKEHACSFSLLCLREALELFRMLDDMNGRQLKVSDLMGSTPRVSVPITIGNGELPNEDVSISSFLSEVCHELV